MDCRDPIDLTAEIERYFEPSSLRDPTCPECTLLMGPVAVGKTRIRRDGLEVGRVVIDAGDIFISLSKGQYVDFPSFLEEPMHIVGSLVASRAIQERRDIVTELIGHELAPTAAVMDALHLAGYKTRIIAVKADYAQSAEWNLSRSDNNISAYYTEPFHRRWLTEGAAAFRPGQTV